MCAQHFAPMAPSAATKAMALHLSRYAASTFPVDRDAASPPHAGTLRRARYDVLRVSEPPGWQTVWRASETFEHELRTGVAGKRAEVIGLLFESARRGSVSALKQLEAMTRVRSSTDDR